MIANEKMSVKKQYRLRYGTTKTITQGFIEMK